jgi:hypothetical protein
MGAVLSTGLRGLKGRESRFQVELVANVLGSRHPFGTAGELLKVSGKIPGFANPAELQNGVVQIVGFWGKPRGRNTL